MATPRMTGTTAIKIGTGRRSCLSGGAGTVNLWAWPGGSRRGGRLNSSTVPSSAVRSAASGGSYGAISRNVPPTATC
jgi:hypothetical protein